MIVNILVLTVQSLSRTNSYVDINNDVICIITRLSRLQLLASSVKDCQKACKSSQTFAYVSSLKKPCTYFLCCMEFWYHAGFIGFV